MNFGIKINKAKKPFAFTLVELLVVIAVIAIVATLSILAFQSAREKSRDAKRIADIQQLRMALELYYNDASGYPPVSAFIAGEAISYVKNGNVKTYINKIPSAPVPADGDCTSQNNSYSYSSENPSTYTINYCLGNQSQEVPKGLNLATATQFYSLSCTDTTWTPDPATYCGDATQTSNCNATRTTAGTLSCSSPTPVCNNNICVECTDNSTCTLPQTCAGSGTPNVCGCSDATWTPDPSSYCGDATQTSNCNNTRTTTGTLVCDSGQQCSSNICVSKTPVLTHAGVITNGTGGALLDGAYWVHVSGNYAYVASYVNNALEIINISNPTTPTHVGSLANGAGGAMLVNPRSVYVSGNYAYVASYGSNALEIINVSNPAAPTHVSSITHGTGGALLNGIASVVVEGNYAYIASVTSDSLEIINISNPSSPTHVGSIVHGSGGAILDGANKVAISGNYAYVVSALFATGNNGALEIINISNPANPTHVGKIVAGQGGALLTYPVFTFIRGNYAYVASHDSRALEIINISNPALPTHVGSITNGTGGALLNLANHVKVVGDYAFMTGDSNNALEVINISNPAAPTHFTSLTHGTGGAVLTTPTSIFIVGNYAYVTSMGGDALEVIKIFN